MLINKKLINKLSVHPLSASSHHAVPGIETKCNYTMCDDPLLHKNQISNRPKALLPDYSTIKASYSGILSMLSLPAKEIIDCAFHDVVTSLLSTLATRDEGGEVKFVNKDVYIILKGKRHPEIGLWLVPIGQGENLHDSIEKLIKKHIENFSVVVLEATATKK